MAAIAGLMREQIRPALAAAQVPILDWQELDEVQRSAIREEFELTGLPILTPLAIDAEHPFPFISGQGLDMVIQTPSAPGSRERLVLLKVSCKRTRWIALTGNGGFVLF